MLQADDTNEGGNDDLFRQSAILVAQMWPPTNWTGSTVVSGGSPPGTSSNWQWGSWRVSPEYLPLLVGSVCGGTLIILLLAAVVIWRCWLLKDPSQRKQYRSSSDEHSLSPASRRPTPTMKHSPGDHWFYNSRILGGHHSSNISSPQRSLSSSHQSPSLGISSTLVRTQSEKRPQHRPLSQPPISGVASAPWSPAWTSPLHHHPNASPVVTITPEISQFAPHQHHQYASSSCVLEAGASADDPDSEMALKTRSLPSWVRARGRPLSTEEDLAELYAKVNFSKKRKNRMRNDEAAIIALSKSRSQCLHDSTSGGGSVVGLCVSGGSLATDTASLVDNEACVVYDERTAL